MIDARATVSQRSWAALKTNSQVRMPIVATDRQAGEEPPVPRRPFRTRPPRLIDVSIPSRSSISHQRCGCGSVGSPRQRATLAGSRRIDQLRRQPQPAEHGLLGEQVEAAAHDQRS